LMTDLTSITFTIRGRPPSKAGSGSPLAATSEHRNRACSSSRFRGPCCRWDSMMEWSAVRIASLTVSLAIGGLLLFLFFRAWYRSGVPMGSFDWRYFRTTQRLNSWLFFLPARDEPRWRWILFGLFVAALVINVATPLLT
jgi:hypothetical protein